MKIGIIGTGAFGIAIASVLYRNKNNITMWTAFEEEKGELENNRVRKNLNNYEIPSQIHITNDIEETMKDKDLIFIAVPAEFVSSTCKKMIPFTKNQHFCIASKGIEEGSGLFLFDVLKNILHTNNISVISGPSFAIDIVNNVPIGLSLASNNDTTANIVYNALENEKMKIFINDDLIGTCLCGAIKNVIAIASGIIDGLGYPISTQAMLITQSLHDIEELIKLLGGYERTILSFAGFGDIILTCTSTKSRNYSFGKLIGKRDNNLEDYMKNNTIEGLTALRSISKIINDKSIDIPFIRIIYEIVYNGLDPNELVLFLTKK